MNLSLRRGSAIGTSSTDPRAEFTPTDAAVLACFVVVGPVAFPFSARGDHPHEHEESEAEDDDAEGEIGGAEQPVASGGCVDAAIDELSEVILNRGDFAPRGAVFTAVPVGDGNRHGAEQGPIDIRRQ